MSKTASIISLILFFALSLGAITLSGTLYEDASEEGNTVTQSTQKAPGKPTPDNNDQNNQNNQNTVKPGDAENGQTEFAPVYYNCLKYVIMSSDVEGLVEDRSQLSLQDRVALYNKLAAMDVPEEIGTLSASGIYDPETHKLMLVKEGVFDEYTAGTEIVLKYNKEFNGLDASYITHSTEITRARCKIIPYMGYLLVSSLDENGEMYISLCDKDANVLVENMGDMKPYFARDYDNRPLFTDGSKHYYYDGSKFVSVARDKIRSELFYDYPAAPLADYDGTTEVKYSTTYDQYRFVNYKTGKNFISTRYKYAFNFSENGLAVVMLTTENEVRIINTSAKKAIGSSAWKIFPGSNAYVEYVFTLPDTLGIESIGCTGFDNGWLRLRVQAQNRMSNSYGLINQDIERLVNSEGEYFDIPAGYTIEGYSNGVILLSKEGLYGYYSIDGYWIAQPIYDYARPFIQGLAVVGYEDGTVGMIDTKGNIVLPMIYTHISDVSSGVVSAYIEGVGWNIYNLCEV